ncbi:siderophore-interacting protein [Euzebya sp.]|uniref:siderophore-interacting protein n=1 Tax=Euzebya sp. TaxID=1971409 RepID=UPI003515E6D4
MATPHGTVVRTERLSDHMVRVVLGGEGLRGWAPNGFTDAYLVLWFPPADAPYAAPFDVESVKAGHPPERWPIHRHYTVRRWDAAAGELTIDFVVHGDEGVAGPWAASAQPGDRVVVSLPGGAYRPDPDADFHLLVGDESALPAIAASLEVLPAGRRATAVLVCDGPADEVPLDCPGDLEVIWCHRVGSAAAADLLLDAVRALEWPAGRVDAFVHGEAGEVRGVRRHLLADRGLDRAQLSASGYWRRTMTDEAWRAVKRDWNADVERDVR